MGCSDYEKPREGTFNLLRQHSEGDNPLREANHDYTKLLQHVSASPKT